jgi:hypothetical protein
MRRKGRRPPRNGGRVVGSQGELSASRAERGRLSDSQTSFEQFAVTFRLRVALWYLVLEKVSFTAGRYRRVDECEIEIQCPSPQPFTGHRDENVTQNLFVVSTDCVRLLSHQVEVGNRGLVTRSLSAGRARIG